MIKKDNNIKIIIGILFSITIIIFWFLLWTHSYLNESIFAVAIMLFALFFLWVLFSFYKSYKKTFISWLIIALFLLLIISLVKWILYEHKVNKLHIGMTIKEVENLYWAWTSWLWFWSKWLWSADCLKCSWKSYQFSYKLNSNLWYTHLQDSYHICYINNIVCDFDRIGL